MDKIKKVPVPNLLTKVEPKIKIKEDDNSAGSLFSEDSDQVNDKKVKIELARQAELKRKYWFRFPKKKAKRPPL